MGYLKRRIIEQMEPKEEPPSMGRMKDLLITIYGGGDEAVEAAKQIAGLSEIVPHDDEPRWIPVEERLPEGSGAVLVAAHEFEFFLGEPFTDQAVWFDGEFWTGESPSAKYPFRITHWMPLPEPPEVK